MTEEAFELPAGAVIMGPEILNGPSPEEILERLGTCRTARETAPLFALAENRYGYLTCLLDETEGEELRSLCSAAEVWKEVCRKCEAQLLSCARKERPDTEPEEIVPGQRRLAKLMLALGWRDGCGWWVPCDRTDRPFRGQ